MGEVIEFKRKAPEINPNDFQKVWLPGEWAWVIVKAIEDGIMSGEINNHVASDLHPYRLRDLVRFVWAQNPSGSDLYSWVPLFEGYPQRSGEAKESPATMPAEN